MTEEEFLALGRAGFNRIPLHLETLADLDTPLSIYLKLANRPGSYLLESVIGGERFGRYSIVGLPAREMLEVRGVVARIIRDGAESERHVVADPLAFVDRYLASFRAAPPGPAFCRGTRGLLRIRHGALHRAPPRRHPQARPARPSGNPAAALRGAG